MEIWKDVVGYEGFYKISDFGNVKSIYYKKNGAEIILRPKIGNGYFRVNLWKDGKGETKLIHMLVGMAFVDKDYVKNGLVVNHINFNKQDNKLSNLEIVTYRENSNMKHITHSSKYTGVCWDKNKNKWVSSITVNGTQKRLGSFCSEKEASDYYEAALICVNDGRINDIKSAIKIRVKASRYKHIHFNSKRKGWVVQPYVNGKYTYVGSYKTEQEAYEVLQNLKRENKI